MSIPRSDSVWGCTDQTSLFDTEREDLLEVLNIRSGQLQRPSAERALSVLHTRTIPLSSMIDLDYYRAISKKESLVTREHHSLTGCSTPRCKYRQGWQDSVPDKCPCLSILEENASPICFLEYLERTGRQMFGTRTIDPQKQLDRTAVCYDHCNVLDDKYPSVVRESTGLSGFGRRNIRVERYLNLLPWYYDNRKDDRVIGVVNGLKQFEDSDELAPMFKHILYTIDGVLVKLFTGVPDYPWTYDEIKTLTVNLFVGFGREYTRLNDFNFYANMKAWSGHVKHYLYAFTPELRFSALIPPETNFSRLMQPYLDFIGSFVNRLWACSSIDYTASQSYLMRLGTLCQTRSVGYPPRCLQKKTRDEYIALASGRRDWNPPSREDIHKARQSLRAYLHRRLPSYSGCLLNKDHPFFAEAMVDVEIRLKDSASLLRPKAEGGRLADAQEIIQKMLGKSVPVYNLGDLSIEEMIVINKEDPRNYEVYLFWISFQVILNYLSTQFKQYEPYFRKLPIEHENVNDYRAVWIQEPGKLRPLTKGHSCVYWCFSPLTLMFQNCLAEAPELKAGLHGTAQSFRHYNAASAWPHYYDNKGFLKPEVNHLSTDLTAATDYIYRCRNAGLITELAVFLGCPKAYGEMYLRMITLPNRTKAVSRISFHDIEREAIGTMHESHQFLMVRGLPMGAVGAKIGLTLHQCVVIEMSRSYMEGLGVAVEINPQPLIERFSKKKFLEYNHLRFQD